MHNMNEEKLKKKTADFHKKYVSNEGNASKVVVSEVIRRIRQ